MNSLDRYHAHPGLSIPIVTILDGASRVLEEQQRAAVRFAIQGGHGADIIFAAGTTGEWDRLDNPRRQQVCQIVVDECRRSSVAHGNVEAWVGITAHTQAETLENLDHAIAIAADAAVIAPLSIADAGDPADFVIREIGSLFERRGHQLPVFLYDNAEIAAAGKPPHLHTRDVKRMSELEYVRGIKVTANKTVLGNYTRAASHFKLGGEFAIYAGNPYLIFELFRPPIGLGGRLRRLWNRYFTQRALPHGVVAGPANAMPREWQRSWQVSRKRDAAAMDRYAAVLQDFRAICDFSRDGHPYRPTIACLKAALAEIGVCESSVVAPGTPELNDAEHAEFARRFANVRRRASSTLEPGWQSACEPHARLVLAQRG